MRLIERTLWLVGVVALGWVASIYLSAKFDQARQSRELEELRFRRPAAQGTSAGIPLRPPASARPRFGEARSSFEPPDRAPEPALAAPRKPPVEGALIGRVEVPRLGVSAIVREGVASSTLRRAVGHVPETALPGEEGNAALAGHRDTYFKPLKNVRAGDRIRVTTPDGLHEYRVTTTRIVNPDDVSALNPTREPTLTLITCYPFNYLGSAPQRLIVTATAADIESHDATAESPAGEMPTSGEAAFDSTREPTRVAAALPVATAGLTRVAHSTPRATAASGTGARKPSVHKVKARGGKAKKTTIRNSGSKTPTLRVKRSATPKKEKEKPRSGWRKLLFGADR